MAFTVDWKAALVFAAVIPLLAAVVFGIMLWTMPRYKKVQAGLDRVLGITRENLTGVRVVRAFGRRRRKPGAFRRATRELTNLQVFVGRISSPDEPADLCADQCGGGSADLGGSRAGGRRFPHPGRGGSLLNYMSQILVELIKMANLIINISKALACANRISNVLETESTLASPGFPKGFRGRRGTVVFENVSLTYAGAGAPSLTNLSFRAGPGNHRHHRRYGQRKVHGGQPDSPFLRRYGGQGAGGRRGRAGV